MLKLNLNRKIARNVRRTSQLLSSRSPSADSGQSRKATRGEKNKNESSL